VDPLRTETITRHLPVVDASNVNASGRTLEAALAALVPSGPMTAKSKFTSLFAHVSLKVTSDGAPIQMEWVADRRADDSLPEKEYVFDVSPRAGTAASVAAVASAATNATTFRREEPIDARPLGFAG